MSWLSFWFISCLVLFLFAVNQSLQVHSLSADVLCFISIMNKTISWLADKWGSMMAQWNILHAQCTPALTRLIIKIKDVCSADVIDNSMKSCLALVIKCQVCLYMYKYLGLGFEFETWLRIVAFSHRNCIMNDMGRSVEGLKGDRGQKNPISLPLILSNW